MSDVAEGPGWWLASDGKWYSPEQSPGYAEPVASEAGPPPTAYPPSGPPPGYPPGYPPPGPAPGYPTSGYATSGYLPPGYPPPYGYAPAGGPYGFAPVAKTNGLAVAAMVCSFFFWLYGIGAVLGIVFGFIARAQIKRAAGAQQGKGMALAGIIIGFAGLAIGIALLVVVLVVVAHCEHNGTCTTVTTNPGS